MELNQIITPLRKWWWLLMAATIVAAISSFIVATFQPPIYRTHTTLVIGRSIQDPNPNSGQYSMDVQLAETYAELAKREIVYTATANTLGLPELPKYTVQTVANRPLLEIAVTDTNPERAMVVANELANQLILNSPTGPKPQEQERQKFMTDQLAYFQTQINDSLAEVTRLQEQMGTMTSARQIQDTRAQIATLQDKVTALQRTYNDLLANMNTGAANSVSVLVPADVPTLPVGPNKLLIAFLAAISGLALASAAAYGMEFLSNTLRSTDEIGKVIQAPVIGYVPEVKGENRGIYAATYPYSSFAESFRLLRTNLEFTRLDRSMKTIMISSPGPGDGKSTVATNLALVMAQSNKKVVLIGGDIRQPTIHDLLNIQNDRGLTDLISGRYSLDEVIRPYGDPQLMVIPSGATPPNPAELLSSTKMNQILAFLKDHYDIILIDTTPFFISDATIMASRVDGILLVVRPDYTRKDALMAVKDQVQRIGVKIFGVVVNAIPAGANQYSAYYGRYGYGSEDEPEGLAAEKKAKVKAKAPNANRNGTRQIQEKISSQTKS